jgi:rod shape-determining protein MreD
LPLLSASSRREIGPRSYPVSLYFVVPFLAIGLQSFVTLHFSRFSILDLPLLVTIYFAILSRSPIAATFMGTFVGLAQDALTHRPVGVNGIANSIVGYTAASLSARIDIENHLARLLLCFLFTFLYGAIFNVITARVLALGVDWSWLHELIRAVVNAVVGVALFALLDLAKRRD